MKIKKNRKLNRNGDVSTAFATALGVGLLSYAFVHYTNNNLATIKYENLSQHAREAFLTFETDGKVKKYDLLEMKNKLSSKLDLKPLESLDVSVKAGDSLYYDVNTMPNELISDWGEDIKVKFTLNYLDNNLSYTGTYLHPISTKSLESMNVELSTKSTNRDTDSTINTESDSDTITPNKPVIDISPSTNIKEDDDVTITAIAIDPNGDDLTYEWQGRTNETSKYSVGKHKISVVAIDPDGNVSEPATVEFEVVNDAPTTPIITIDSDGGMTSHDNITITAKSYDSEDDDISYVWTNRDSEINMYSVGTHTVSVYAMDSNGNKSAETTETFTISNTKPSTPIISISKESDIQQNELVQITAKSTSPDGNDLNYIWTNRPEEISKYDIGTHTISVYAIDNYGNKSETSTITFDVKNSAPTKPIIKLSQETGITPSTELEITASSTDANDDDLTYTWTGRDNEFNYYSVGSHTVSVYATDSYGNQSETTILTFDVESDTLETPIITISPLDDITAETLVTITANVSSVDPNDDRNDPNYGQGLVYHWTGRGGDTNTDEGIDEGMDTSTYSIGTHTVKVYTTDGFGNTSATATATFEVKNALPTTPEITISPLSGITSSTPVTITANSTDSDGDDITYIWDNRLSETDTYSIGTHTVNVYAIDSKGGISGIATVTFEVENVPPTTPEITISPSGEITSSTPVTITANSTDSDGDDITYIWDNRLSETDIYSIGTHTVNVYAIDSKGGISGIATVTFNVKNTPPTTPAITISPSSEITSSTPVTITAHSIDPDGGSITYVWGNRLSETDIYSIGIHTVNVRAIDSRGGMSGIATVTFEVKDTP